MAPKSRKKDDDHHADGDEEAVALSEELMELSDLGRTADGTGITYRSLTCVGKRISTIKIIEPFVHLRNIDLSQNSIKDVAQLKPLVNLLSLNLARNILTTVAKAWELKEEEQTDGVELFPHLVHLDLSGNAFKELPKLPCRSLTSLSFARNEIASCAEFGGHEKLEKLDLSENKLATVEGLAGMPALTELDVSSNLLGSLAGGISEVPELRSLDLAKNKFATLEGPWLELTNLASLNVAGCCLATTALLAAAVRQLPLLRSLGAKGNPFQDGSSEASMRLEVLICHWRLSSIDGAAVAPEEKEQARLLNVSRLEEERAKRLAEEAANAGAAGDGGAE